jgi:hypothetical protein
MHHNVSEIGHLEPVDRVPAGDSARNVSVVECRPTTILAGRPARWAKPRPRSSP